MWSYAARKRGRTNRSGHLPTILETSRFREAVDRLRDDQMIEYAYVDERERLFEPACDELVRSARLRESGRMIVVEHKGRGIVREGSFYDLARMHRSAVDRAAEEILNGNQAMAAVQMQRAKNFVLAGTEMDFEEFPRERRGGEHG